MLLNWYEVRVGKTLVEFFTLQYYGKIHRFVKGPKSLQYYGEIHKFVTGPKSLFKFGEIR